MTRRPFEEQVPKPQVIPPKQQITPKQETPSMFDGTPKKPTKEEFERHAAEVNDRLNSYPERSAELIPLFMKMLNDKTLPENRSILTNNIETEIIGKLMQLGLDMDADELQQNGAGSIGLTVLLMKSFLMQRDKINALEYSLLQIKNELKTLKNIAPLDNKTDKI